MESSSTKSHHLTKANASVGGVENCRYIRLGSFYKNVKEDCNSGSHGCWEVRRYNGDAATKGKDKNEW